MPTITSLNGQDLESARYDIGANINYASPAPRSAFPAYGVEQSGIRLSDDGFIAGNDRTIYCSDGPGGDSAIISLFRTAVSRVSESTLIQDLRFGYGKFGIMTPWAADRPPSGYTVEQWYQQGQHIMRRIRGQAYGIGIRVAGYDTLLEDFILSDCGGASSLYRTFGALFLGPNPVVRRGIIRNIKHSVNGVESVGLGFSADCHGGLIEDVLVSNPAQLPLNSIALWLGHSEEVIVRKFTARNFKYAFDYSGISAFIEDSQSINCEFGFGRIADQPNVRLKNVWDHKFVNGAWVSEDVSNI